MYCTYKHNSLVNASNLITCWSHDGAGFFINCIDKITVIARPRRSVGPKLINNNDTKHNHNNVEFLASQKEVETEVRYTKCGTIITRLRSRANTRYRVVSHFSSAILECA